MKTLLAKIALGAVLGAAVTTTSIVVLNKNISPEKKEAPVQMVQTKTEEPVKQEPVSAPSEKKEATSPIQKTKSEKISGTYRCWSFNVDGYGGTCSSPDIVLKSDGTYSMSSEKGTYEIQGEQIVLSESEIRGPGTFLEGRMQIRFEYNYNEKKYTITYSLRENATTSTPSASPTAPLDLTIVYPSNIDGIDWINVVELRAKTANKKPTYQAVAYAENKKTLKAYFKEEKNEVQTGLQYDVYTSSGNEELLVGSINVPKSNSLIKLTLNAPLPPSFSPTPEPAEESITVPAPTPETKPTEEPSVLQEEKLPYEGIPCDPNIPNYSQPGCIPLE